MIKMQSAELQKKLELKKSVQYAVKATKNLKAEETVDLSKRTIMGFYNSFLFLDDAGDVILPGAFNRSLKDHGVKAPEGNYRIKHLLFHDWTKVLSVPNVLEERTVKVGKKDVSGLYYETPIPNTTDGNDTLIKYQQNIYDQHSIGYQYLDGEYIERGSEAWKKIIKILVNPEAAEGREYMFVWKEIKLFEGSTVAFGCNELTPYLGSKGSGLDGETSAFALLSKIDIIKKQLTLGEITKDAAFHLEMQMNQVKQHITELFGAVPDIKDTLEEKARKEKSEQKPVNRFASLGKNLG